jgi:enolase-phosphatase E1
LIEAIVTDIEGTTTSIAFVHDALFPYAKARVRGFLRENAGVAQVKELISEVEQLEGHPLSSDEAANLLERWMTEDRKLSALKALQGLIWKVGYESGELRGHVYADAPQYLRLWHAAGIRLYVYSSGSAEAQKLLFGHTEYGDLRPLFSGYFDTRVGAKRDIASYLAIVHELQLPAAAVLFLSDTVEELDAAHGAGLSTCQLVRDYAERRPSLHRQAADFSAVSF